MIKKDVHRIFKGIGVDTGEALDEIILDGVYQYTDAHSPIKSMLNAPNDRVKALFAVYYATYAFPRLFSLGRLKRRIEGMLDKEDLLYIVEHMDNISVKNEYMKKLHAHV